MTVFIVIQGDAMPKARVYSKVTQEAAKLLGVKTVPTIRLGSAGFTARLGSES